MRNSQSNYKLAQDDSICDSVGVDSVGGGIGEDGNLIMCNFRECIKKMVTKRWKPLTYKTLKTLSRDFRRKRTKQSSAYQTSKAAIITALIIRMDIGMVKIHRRDVILVYLYLNPMVTVIVLFVG